VPERPEQPEQPEEPGEHAARPADSEAAAPQQPTSNRRAGMLIGLLCLLLGFALVVQVRSTTDASGLGAARQEDLVSILDDLSAREDRLRQDIATQEELRDRLVSGDDQSDTALAEALLREQQLAILAGTVAAEGPGIELTVSDPGAEVGPEVLLNAIQELRAAGAEAMQVGDVRIGVSSAVTGRAGLLVIDGIELTAPYTIRAIGDPQTLEIALNIPGGVVNAVSRAGGEATIEQQDAVVVSALRPVDDPEYARPAEDEED